MPKLNIAHHKSYHPYRRDNIERVRRDEEEAELQRLKQEGKLLMADSEARMHLLREKSGGSSQKRRKRSASLDLSMPPPPPPEDTIVAPTGHINFFNSLESTRAADESSASASSLEKKMREREAEKGFALAPSTADLTPWYATKPKAQEEDSTLVKADDVESEDAARAWKSQQRRRREAARKVSQDPLTELTTLLRKRGPSAATSSTQSFASSRQPPQAKSTADPPDAISARLSRESSERARAEALIQVRKRAMEGSDAASSVGGDTPLHRRNYSDVYNKDETLEAGRRRGRWSDGAGSYERDWHGGHRDSRHRPR